MLHRNTSLRAPLLVLAMLSTPPLLFLTVGGCGGDGSCELQEDCDDNQICNVGENLCVPRPACTTNADCEGTEQCLSGDGEGGVECRAPANCTEADDVNAYCREKFQAQGDEVYSCNVQSDTCKLNTEEMSTCSTDSDCSSGARCLPQPMTSGILTCRAPRHCGEAEDVQAYCSEKVGSVHAQGSQYSCEGSIDPDRPVCTERMIDQQARYYILIEDVTTADCDLTMDANGFDPGSDITFVELQDDQGMSLGWGKTESYMQGVGINDFTRSDVLNGKPARLIEMGEQEDIDNRCPVGDASGRFTQQSVVALGCTGTLVVGLLDSEGKPVVIENGLVLDVGEYASVCNNNVGGSIMGTDHYVVYLCPETHYSEPPSDLECKSSGIALTPPRSGYQRITLSDIP